MNKKTKRFLDQNCTFYLYFYTIHTAQNRAQTDNKVEEKGLKITKQNFRQNIRLFSTVHGS